MERHDPTPAVVLSWLVELARTLPGLAPGALPAATRERIAGACDDAAIAGDDAVTEYARACAREHRPLDTTVLEATLPPGEVTALRATVARVELAHLTADAADRLLARATGRRRLGGPATLAWEAALTTIAAPLAVTSLAAATTAKLVQRIAPPMTVDVDPDDDADNLLVHVVANVLRAWTANAAVRLLLARLPFTVTVALRDGAAEASVAVGHGRAAVVGGIDPGATVLLEGELGPVLRAATGSVLEHLGHVRIGRA